MDAVRTGGALLVALGMVGIGFGYGFLPGAGLLLLGVAVVVDPPLRYWLAGLSVLVFGFTLLSL